MYWRMCYNVKGAKCRKDRKIMAVIYENKVKELGKEAVLWYTKYNDVKKAHTVMPAMLNYELKWDQKPVKNTPVFITGF